MTPGSLHSHIDWRQWLRALQLPITTASLPSRTTCPVCKTGSMMIFDDRIGYGQWVWCRDCHHAGDLLRTAGSIWNCEPAETVKRLVRHGFQLPLQANSVDLYIRNHHKPLRRWRRLWRSAQNHLPKSSTELRRKVHQLGCPPIAASADFLRGYGMLFGSQQHAELEMAFYPRSFRPARNGLSRVGSSDRLFRGTGWDEVLVIPRWSLPGRLTGFHFVGRGWKPEDVVLQCYGAEAGLAFHPQTVTPRKRDSRKIVATRNLLTYLKMQCRHWALEREALPLVHWVAGEAHKTNVGWDTFRGMDVVLWEPKLNATALAAAYAQNCQLSIRSDAHVDLGDGRKGVPYEDLAAVLKRAKPWHEYANQLLRQLDDHALQQLLSELMMKQVDVQQMLTSCSQVLQERARKLVGAAFEYRSIIVNRQVVAEHDGRWSCRDRRGPGELIVDAVLRIERVIHRAQRQETLYQGRILYRDREVPFCVEQAVAERRTFHWMQQLLLQAGLGVMQYNPAWQRYATVIATQLHPPALVRGADRIGWDDDRRSLVLPRYELPFGESHRAHEGGFRPSDPGYNLPEPVVISPADVDELGDDTAKQAVLAVVAVFAAIALSPALRQPMPNALLSGSGAGHLLQVCATACGVTTVKPKSAKDCGRQAEAAQANAWPYAIDAAYCPSRQFRRWLAQHEGADGLVTAVDVETAENLALTGQWYVVDSRLSCPTPSEACEAASRIFTAFLAHAMRGQLTFDIDADFTTAVAAELDRWLIEHTHCGSSQPGELIERPSDDMLAERFVGSLERLRGKGLAAMNKPSSTGLTLQQFDHAQGGAVLIPKDAYLATMHKAWDVTLSAFQLTAALAGHKYALFEDRIDAWVINGAWMARAIRRHQRAAIVKPA